MAQKSPDFEECFLKLSDFQARLQHVAKIRHNLYDGDSLHLYVNLMYQNSGPKAEIVKDS
jgi:hypothetical protein